MKICPKCGKAVSYNSYFGAYICGNCNWEEREGSEQPGFVWLLIDGKDIEDTLPAEGQQIFLSIAEGEGLPFTDPVRAKADRAALRDFLKLNPHWLILWQPEPPPPPAPTHDDVLCRTHTILNWRQAPMSQTEGSEKGGDHGKQTGQS